MPENPGNILSKISSPEDVKKLDTKELLQLCDELRRFIIDELSCNPGHFGASLGVIELTVALHYVLNLPNDQIIWDVGHQAYGHKILTGRRDVFHTNRKKGGISGFPNRQESEYDSFGTGHSSTSISASLGMAAALQLKNDPRQIVAVIGDGAMTGGMAFEGLLNTASLKSDMLIILNDNNMAISPNVGAMKEYLLDISTSQTYNRVKDDVWRFLGKVRKFGPNAQDMIQKINNGLKTIVLRQSNMFESLNIRYFGPVDGHDVVYLTKVLEDMRHIKGPKLLHVLTQKGKGFAKAEADQTYWHAPAKFDRHTGEIIKETSDTPKPIKYQEVFGKTLTELAEANKKIVGITPAMPTGSSMDIMMEKFPERCFDVGIAEQHAVTFSAGLAAQGLIPFCNIYSTFAQRAYDQIIHDVAIQKLPVVFCLDRAGIVGQDGVTHHGTFDIPALRCIPGITICAPMDEIELRHLMYTAQKNPDGPFVIRYPRGSGVHVDWQKPMQKIKIGTGRIIEQASDIAVLSVGHPGNLVRIAAKSLREKENIRFTHVDMRFIKPLDEDILHKILKTHTKIVTIEDGAINGGFGSSVLEFVQDHNYQVSITRLGIPDKFIYHGTQAELRKDCGFDTESIRETIRKMKK